jgi:fibro-slime domain-containing protein
LGSTVDGVDTDCNGTVSNPDELDNDGDGWIVGLFVIDDWLATQVPLGGSDCNDGEASVNPGALDELLDGADTDCNPATTNPDETDADNDGYIPGIVPVTWLGPLPIPDGGSDCNDNEASVNPGADDGLGSTVDGVDTDCNGTVSNPDELDNDGDGWIVGLFVIDDWLKTQIPDGGEDCDDGNPDVNPGMDEIGGNGIDDDCDGTEDSGLDEDGDGYLSGFEIGVDDCYDTVTNDPESQYFGIDPFTVNPGVLEVIGDGIDNNCDDTIDEVSLVTVDDQYNADGDNVLEISASGILLNDQIPPTVPSPAILPVDVTLVTPPIGDLILDPVDGSFTYSPTDLLFGSDSFEYSISYLNSDNELTQSNISTVNLTQKFCGKDITEFDNVIIGTNSKDNLNGSNDDDLILGLGGNDKINGKKGNDCIYGGDGNDNINGHDGNDEIHGGDGNDKIRGHAGDDKIFGDNGDDRITGNNGNDEIHGGDGNDKIVGNQGDDKLFGDNGDDHITGNNGKDEIHGGDGNDKISGNNHDDQLFGDNGDDKIGGGNGDDLIDGGDDYDYCKGNKGDDTIINCEKGDSNTETGDQKQLTGIIRDFKKNHDDMEQGCSGGLCSSVEPGIVKSVLGSDGKPEFNQDTISTNGQANFIQWYNDVNGVNKSDDITLTLDNTITSDPSVYTFESGPGFFPIDGKLFGNQGLSHNYHFTIEFHSTIEFENGQMFKFTGDDDVWVFIDDNLVIDLGGVHPKKSAEVTSADLIALGLVPGVTYDIDIFFAERQTVQSNFRIDTSMGMS